MADAMTRLKLLWDQMGMSQRVIFLSLSGAILVTLLLFFTWLGKEDFVVLYSNLEPQDSAKVIEVLQKQNVAYKLGANGSVSVPAGSVNETRVKLAGEGVPSGGGSGYELFDNQGIGVSEFSQNVNFKRALEGELARSISSIQGVDKARVHIVLPQQALFEEERQEASASVVLELARVGTLRPAQVQAVQRMVASGVEGLAPENVTILDSFGNLISREYDEIAGLSSAQLDLKRQVETYLSRKAQGTLESVLGAGTSIVRVDAILDFEKVERTREVIDPENAVILSEQRDQVTKENEGETSESSTTNYEFNRMVENILGSTGNISKLNVAILIDGSYTQGADGKPVYQPRSSQELDGYRKVVENIVGLDSERGDRIEVLNVKFHEPSLPASSGFLSSPLMDKVPSILNKLLFIAALLLLFAIFRKMGVKLVESVSVEAGKAQVVGATSPASRIRPDGSSNDEYVDALDPNDINQDAKRKIKMEEQAKSLAIEKPEEVARLIKTWMTTKS